MCIFQAVRRIIKTIIENLSKLEILPDIETESLFQLSEMPIDTLEDVANAFECWEWQERQAKFIVNSCRVYEFWGYDWRIPLWNNEMMDFWARVPLGLRVGKRLYDGFLFSSQFYPDLERKQMRIADKKFFKKVLSTQMQRMTHVVRSALYMSKDPRMGKFGKMYFFSKFSCFWENGKD